METETKTPEQIVEALTADGWTMTFTCLNPGDYKTQSDWSVTLTREGRAFSTEYHKGAAHRRWIKDAGYISGWKGQFPKAPKAGDRAPYSLGRGVSLWQEGMLRQYTEPIPPTMDEVFYCLTIDASGVRCGQTFEEWAGEYGYDTDSRKAEACFNACTNNWRGMVRLGADFDKLDELFHDY